MWLLQLEAVVDIAALPSTGWPEIDVQHADLLRRVAELRTCVLARDAAGASAVLEGLLEATVRHCTTEDELMERSQYPERVAHKGAHDFFIQDLCALAGELADTGLNAVVEEWAVVRVPEWLAFHIETNDAPLVRHLLRSRNFPIRRPVTS